MKTLEVYEPWNYKKALKVLNEPLIEHKYRERAEELLRDLEIRELEVILSPAPEPSHEGHKIRIPVNQNPKWYSELYWSYLNEKGEPKLKRKSVKNSLERIISYKDKEYIEFNNPNNTHIYDAMMREFIQYSFKEGIRDSSGNLVYQPDITVTEFHRNNSIPF